MRVAHFSDIHFFHFHKSPLQFFSKRFLGNFNYYFNRKHVHDSHLAYEVLPRLKKQGVTHLIISGDYTTTASSTEFQLMRDYVNTVKEQGFQLFTLPGNHDAYTKSAHRNQSFFSYLGDLVPFGSLPDQHVAAFPLYESWQLILIDCSFPTPLYKSTGIFSLPVEKSLKSLLNTLPKNANLVVTCHYPFERYKYPKAHLERGSHLKEIILNDPRIKLYLHGHRHLHRIETLNHLTIADSGSISFKKKSSYNVIDFTETDFTICKYDMV